MSRTFRVEWAIDVDAETPEEAARKAREYQQWPREGYWCGVFEVTEHDWHNTPGSFGPTTVDLDEIDQQEQSEESTGDEVKAAAATHGA